ncbi:MAG: TIR domain-containing protein [Erythrobacter sp.]
MAKRPLIFLSYSRTDLACARPVVALLEGAGFDLWWDGKLEGGENYLKTTEAALEGADCVVVLWSRAAVDSHWVRDEAQRGRERGCLVPLSLDGTMAPLGFRQFQLLDITGWSGKAAAPEAGRILAAVRAMTGAGTIEAPPREADISPPAAAAAPRPSLPLSRRGLVIAGGGLASAAAVLGAWRLGLLGGTSAGAISMVVLPFANLTGDADKKWFSDGLSNELRSVLARNPRLRVSAPTSSSAMESEDDFAIGRKLGVGHILRGSVQRDATRMRISAELVAIEGGVVRWANSFDRGLEDVFAVQSEIAETVALALVAEIADDDETRRSVEAQQEVGGTRNVTAFEAFLRGQALSDLSAGEETDRAALAQFDAAIAADPTYAAAHARRATMLAGIANAASDPGEVQQLYRDAIAAAERAIALEDRLAQGHLALGFALNNGQLNRAAAMPHYRKAEQLAPGDADALRSAATFYSYGSEVARAQQMIAGVLELDPLNARAFRAAGYIALFARDYPAVIARMERALALNPSLVSAQFAIANARLMMGDAAGALAAAKAERVPLFSLTASAIAAEKLGDREAARAALASILTDYGETSLYQQAQIFAQRGEVAAALDLLERAFAVRDPGLLFTRNDPLLDPLRGEARLTQLLLRLGS